MKVRRKPSGSWEARVFDPHTQKVRAKTYKTKKEAEAWRDEQQVALRRGTYVDPLEGKQTVAQWWERYRTTANWQKLKPSTQSRYEGLMRHQVLPYLGNRRLAALKRMDIEAWIGDLARKQDIKPGTVNNAHRVLRLVLQTAVDASVVGVNPARGVKGLKPQREAMRFLTVGEVDALRDAVPDRYKAFISTLAWTGLRLGEATALRIENVDLLRGRLSVVEAHAEVGGIPILGETKTDGSRRVVTLDRLLVKELQAHLEAFPPGPEGLVFTSPEGNIIRRGNLRRRVWTPALHTSGIARPWPRIHDLRHTAVAFAIAVGAHPKEIQARAGHSSIMVTMDRYGHLFEGQDIALADKLGYLRESGGAHLVRTWSRHESNVIAMDEREPKTGS